MFKLVTTLMKIASTILFLLLSSCISGKNTNQTSIKEISFGNGGGFTGGVKSFTLRSGKLYEKDKELKNIDSKIASEIFKKARGLEDFSFYETGNMYSFIEIKTKEKVNRIVWAYGSQKVDKKLIDLHASLMSLIK